MWMAIPSPSRSAFSISEPADVKISVIITTYNRPDALSLVLRALGAQNTGDFEFLVADDGSTPQAAATLDALRPNLPYELHHVWHADEGFRAPMARKRAAAAAPSPCL